MSKHHHGCHTRRPGDRPSRLLVALGQNLRFWKTTGMSAGLQNVSRGKSGYRCRCPYGEVTWASHVPRANGRTAKSYIIMQWCRYRCINKRQLSQCRRNARIEAVDCRSQGLTVLGHGWRICRSFKWHLLAKDRQGSEEADNSVVGSTADTQRLVHRYRVLVNQGRF